MQSLDGHGSTNSSWQQAHEGCVNNAYTGVDKHITQCQIRKDYKSIDACLITSRSEHGIRCVRPTGDIKGRKQSKGDVFVIAVDKSHKRPKVKVTCITSTHGLYIEEMRIRKAALIVAMFCFYIEECPYVFIVKQSKKHGIKLTKYDIILDREKLRCCRKPPGKLTVTRHVEVSDGILFLDGNSKTVTKYNVHTNEWTTTMTLQTPVQTPVVSKNNDNVYTIGKDVVVQTIDLIKESVDRCRLPHSVHGARAIPCRKELVLTNEIEQIIYNTETNESRIEEGLSRDFTRLHKVHYHGNGCYAVVTSHNNDVQLVVSEDGRDWRVRTRFEISTGSDVPAVFVEYPDSCPVVPFIDYERQRAMYRWH